jgi:tyrosinase
MLTNVAYRPYLALLEQRIVAHALWEASKFKSKTDAARWKAAAEQVRLPYWDWAATDLESAEAPQMTVEEVTVTRPMPDGSSKIVTIPNPLFSYVFQNTTLRTEYFRDQFLGAKQTVRQPPNSLDQSSDNNAVNSAMTRDYQSRRQTTYGLFSIPTFREFSNTQVNTRSQPNTWSSVESIHNTVHNSVGGSYGHMTAVPYSAVRMLCTFPEAFILTGFDSLTPASGCTTPT